MEDKLLFILDYKKTYPLQTAHGLMFEMGQSQANAWIHRLSPILESALISSGHMPERDGQAFEHSGSSEDAPMGQIIDGTERRKQRPKDLEKQKEAYSGKKKAYTDKNVIITNEYTEWIEYLSQTYNGKTHDKKVADIEDIHYPPSSGVKKDTGFQGYEPQGICTLQPKKKAKRQRTWDC